MLEVTRPVRKSETYKVYKIQTWPDLYLGEFTRDGLVLLANVMPDQAFSVHGGDLSGETRGRDLLEYFSSQDLRKKIDSV